MRTILLALTSSTHPCAEIASPERPRGTLRDRYPSSWYVFSILILAFFGVWVHRRLGSPKRNQTYFERY